MPPITRAPRAPGALGVGAIAGGTVLVLLLQLIPPTNRISPMWRTISEYGLSTDKWVFDLAVGLVALGSIVVFGTLVRRRLLAMWSAPTVLGALWTIGLLVIIAVPKADFARGHAAAHDPGGTVHRLASVVAFVCLPIAVMLGARAVFAVGSAVRRVTFWFGACALVWFLPIIVAALLMLDGGRPWWQTVPVGLIERLMALNEVTAIGLLAGRLFRTEPAPAAIATPAPTPS